MSYTSSGSGRGTMDDQMRRVRCSCRAAKLPSAVDNHARAGPIIHYAAAAMHASNQLGAWLDGCRLPD